MDQNIIFSGDLLYDAHRDHLVRHGAVEGRGHLMQGLLILQDIRTLPQQPHRYVHLYWQVWVGISLWSCAQWVLRCISLLFIDKHCNQILTDSHLQLRKDLLLKQYPKFSVNPNSLVIEKCHSSFFEVPWVMHWRAINEEKKHDKTWETSMHLLP